MSVIEKKKKSAVKIIAAVVGIVLILAALMLFVVPQVMYRMFGEEEAENSTEAPAETQIIATEAAETVAIIAGCEFPMILENGKLEVENLFQYDGINPDCANQDGTDIASILLKNTSEAFLEKADITLLLADGTQLDFTATNLPAGKAAMAFATDNASVDAESVCVDVLCDAAWTEILPLIPEEVSAEVEGTVVTLKNNTNKAISELVIYCRTPLDEEYFGGITYQYTVNNLPAYGSATVDAEECILGTAEVVRIAAN